MGTQAQNTFHVEEYLRWQREVRGRSASTLSSYRETLSALLDQLSATDDPVARGRSGASSDDLRSIDAVALEDFLLRKRQTGAVGAPSTRVREIGALHSFFSYLLRRGVISTDPTLDVGRPKRVNNQPKPVPDLVWRTVWEGDLDNEARAVLGLGFFLGLRRQEITRLSPTHVDRVGQRLVGFVRKGGSDDVLSYGQVVDLFEQRMPQLGAARFAQALEGLIAFRFDAPYLLHGRGWPPRRQGSVPATARPKGQPIRRR